MEGKLTAEQRVFFVRLYSVVQVTTVATLLVILLIYYRLPLSNSLRLLGIVGTVGAIFGSLGIYILQITPYRRWLLWLIDAVYLLALNLVVLGADSYGLYLLFFYFLLVTANVFFMSYGRLWWNILIASAGLFGQFFLFPSIMTSEIRLMLAVAATLGIIGSTHLIWFFAHEATDWQGKYRRSRQAVGHLRQAEKDKTEILSLVSHQLKTPLALIRWSVESVLDNKALSKKERMRLNGIAGTTHVMYNTIEDLSHIFKLTSKAGSQYIRAEKIDVKEVIEEMMAEYKGVIEQRGITLDTVFSRAKVFLIADRIFLKHAITNLVDNAIKYSPDNTTITIKVSRERGRAVISVADKGMGIEAINLDRIFNRFFRTDRAREVNEHGTGLGLYLVKVIVAKMGGRIDVQSKVDKGSIFSLIFPAAH